MCDALKQSNVFPYLLTCTGAIAAFDAAHTSSHRSAVHPSYVYAGVVAPHHVFVAFPIPHAVAVVGVPRAAALGAAATVLSQLLHAMCDAPGMYIPFIA